MKQYQLKPPAECEVCGQTTTADDTLELDASDQIFKCSGCFDADHEFD